MPHCIVPMGDDLYQIFSTIVDDFIYDEGLTEEQVIEHYCASATREAYRHTRMRLDQIKAGGPPNMTLEKAQETIARREAEEKEE